MSAHSKNRYRRALTIAGGGVRGMVSAVWLRTLYHELKTSNIDLTEVDCISGVSVGAILAAALAKPQPYSPDDLVELFEELATQIFSRSYPWIPSWARQIYTGAEYDVKKLHQVLSHHLGTDTRLGDCPKKLVITLYSQKERRGSYELAAPVFAHNFRSEFKKDYQEIRLADLVTGSAAAPLYFQKHRFKHQGRWYAYRDGGMMDNSGIFGAISALCNRYHEDHADFNNLAIFTLGNGGGFWYDPPEDEDGGFLKLQKVKNSIVKSLVQGGEMVANTTIRNLMGNRHHYLNLNCLPEVEMDDVAQIPRLAQAAQASNLTRSQAWLEGYFRLHNPTVPQIEIDNLRKGANVGTPTPQLQI
ncbi:MAG: patatin-like phospholipase family protein [Zetaproteobacteria bacterium]|nr:patatin-like phospholipase family protein [Zetaproteobacteria bacterium]